MHSEHSPDFTVSIPFIGRGRTLEEAKADFDTKQNVAAQYGFAPRLGEPLRAFESERTGHWEYGHMSPITFDKI